jgi:hypothetical protein
MTEKTASDSPTRHTGRCGTAAKHHLTAGTAEGGPCYGPSAPTPPRLSALFFFTSIQWLLAVPTYRPVWSSSSIHTFSQSTPRPSTRRERPTGRATLRKESGNGRRRRFEFRTFPCVQGPVSYVRPAPPAQCTQTPF